MSLNLISSLSFLKNKFESVGSSKGGSNGKSKKDAVFARNPTTRKVDLFSGITESDLDDSSSSSSEDDSDDDIVSSKMTSKANTPITTGYNTPDSRSQDSKSRPESAAGPSADILQKCLEILNSDISDSETLPQPDVVVNTKDEDKMDDCAKENVKPCIFPDYSQGLLKIASPRRVEEKENIEDDETRGNNTLKVIKAAQNNQDTLQSLSVTVNIKGSASRIVSPSPPASRAVSPVAKRARLISSTSSSSSSSDWDDDDDAGPPILEPMVSLVKTESIQAASVTTASSFTSINPHSSNGSTVTTTQSKFSSITTAGQYSAPTVSHTINTSVPNLITNSVQSVNLNTSVLSQPGLIRPGGPASVAPPVQRILLPPVPAGQAQQIILQPSQLLPSNPPAPLQPQIFSQPQSFLGPAFPTVQIVQPGVGQLLSGAGTPLPLLSSSGQLLGTLAGTNNQSAMLNNLQSFTALLSHNSGHVIQQQQSNLINYVHNNNQFPHFPLLQQPSATITTTSHASTGLNTAMMQPKLLQSQPVVIKQEVGTTSSIVRPSIPTMSQGPQLLSGQVVQANNAGININLGGGNVPINQLAGQSLIGCNNTGVGGGEGAAGQQIILSSQNSIVAPVSQTLPINNNPPPPAAINPISLQSLPLLSQPIQPTLNLSQDSLSTANASLTQQLTAKQPPPPVMNTPSISVLPASGGPGSSPVAQLVQDPATGLYNLVTMPQTPLVSTPLLPPQQTQPPTGTSTPLSSRLTSTPNSVCSLNIAGTPPITSSTSSGAGISNSVKGITSSPIMNRTSTPVSSIQSKQPKQLLPSTSNFSSMSTAIPHDKIKQEIKPVLPIIPDVSQPPVQPPSHQFHQQPQQQQLATKFKCGVCNKYFGNTKNLRVHISEIHEGKRGQFPCDICHKVFPRKRNMERHKNALHLKNHPVCPLCQKAVVNIDVHVKRFHRGSQDHKKVCAATA